MLVTKNTPLISNLNMCENIALIKETHENLNTISAEAEATKELEKIGFSAIVKKRISECNTEEIFFTMLIRALMTKERSVIIVSLLSLIGDFADIKSTIDKISILNSSKNLYVLDLFSNEVHYKNLIPQMEGGCAV